MTVHDWLKTLIFALNDDEPDHEFERYPVAQLLAAYNAAMCLISAQRPDLFTEYEVVKLQPGRYQDARGGHCGCNNILDILDQTDAQGGTIREIKGARKTTKMIKRNWNKPSCLNRPQGPDGYVVESASIDPNINGRFTVKPPVPCGVDAYVRVKCVKSPCPLDETMLESPFHADCDSVTAAWHYVMGRMLTGDRDSQNANSESQSHYKLFYDILSRNYQGEQLFESEEKASK